MLSVAQLDERIEKCLVILADNPHSQVFAALADAYRKRGEFGRAFAVCKSGLKHHPDYAPAHIVMAKLYLHQGMYDDAMQSLKMAESQDGVTRASEYLQAEILIGMREFVQARKLIDRLRAIDHASIEIRDLMTQLKSAQAAPINSTRAAAVENRRPDDSTSEPAEAEASADEIDWTSWATGLAVSPHVMKAFAVSLSDNATTPFSVLAEQGKDVADADTVSICAALFAAVDAECRAHGIGVIEELRVERSDGEIWCRRLAGCVIGLAGERGFSYGALRQRALDGATRVAKSDSNQ